MRIVHLSDYYQPQVGYQEANLAKEHAKEGHEVHVITSDRYFPFFNYQEAFYPILGERILPKGTYEEHGVTVHRMPIWFERAAAAIIMLRGVTKLLKELKPDIVISHGVLTPNAYFSGKNKPSLTYRLVYDNHAAAFNTNLYNHFLKRLYLKMWKKFIRPQILKQSDRIIAIGEAEQELAAEILKIQKEKIDIITLGADSDLFRPDDEIRQAARKDLGIGEDEILIVHAGKLTPNKNVDLLLLAFKRLRQEFSNIRLLLIGGGPDDYMNELKKIIAENDLGTKIIWKNIVSNKNLARYFNAADIGVWPGNPSNTIQEAVTAGLPIVIKPHPSNEFLVQNHNGLMMDPGNLERSLVDRLRQMIENPELRKEMGRKSREYGERELSWGVLAREFIS